jgi:hypothetical protein
MPLEHTDNARRESKAPSLKEASPELRRLVERLVADGTLPANAGLSQIRSVLAGTGIVTADGELLHPQDRTSFVIELDQIIERQAQPKRSAPRTAAK